MTRREDSRGTGERGRRAAGPALVVLVALTALVALGCRPGAPGEERPPETVDVEPAISVDVANDPQAVAPKPSLTGILPTDFPEDLPLYLPASLIDFGTAGDRRTVTLLTPHVRGRVAPELDALMRAAGWSVSGGGEARVLRKGARRVSLAIEDGKPGTIFRFEY